MYPLTGMYDVAAYMQLLAYMSSIHGLGPSVYSPPMPVSQLYSTDSMAAIFASITVKKWESKCSNWERFPTVTEVIVIAVVINTSIVLQCSVFHILYLVFVLTTTMSMSYKISDRRRTLEGESLLNFIEGPHCRKTISRAC